MELAARRASNCISPIEETALLRGFHSPQVLLLQMTTLLSSLRKYREEDLVWDALFENLHPSLGLRSRPLFCPCSSEKPAKHQMKALTKRLLALALAVSAALLAGAAPVGSETHGKEYCHDYSVSSFTHIQRSRVKRQRTCYDPRRECWDPTILRAAKFPQFGSKG
jgi:hypothetical protein